MINRIQLILKTKNISPSQFADEIKVQRSGLSHILSGRNNPSLDFILKILKRYPEIDADWLLFGKGEMISLEMKPTGQATAIKEEKPVKVSAQTDLFTLPVTETPVTAPIKKEEKNEPSSVAAPTKPQPTPEPEAVSAPILPPPTTTVVIQNEEKTGKIEKIVIFYENNTFKEYNPK